MAKEIECNSCGARFSEDVAKCPYCGNLNYRGAEKEYMDKLRDIQLDMRSLKETPEEQIEEEIKKQKRRVKSTVIITITIVIIIAISIGLYGKYRERKERAEYLWQLENFPVMDELYEQEKYEELALFCEDAYYEEKHEIWAWEHGDFILVYMDYTDAKDWIEAEESGDTLSKYEYRCLFEDEWSVIGGSYRRNLSEKDREILEPLQNELNEDMQTRFEISEEEYEKLYAYCEANNGYIDYDACKDYVERWYEENK